MSGYGESAFGGGPNDDAAPQVTNVAPTPGATLTPDAAFSLDVTDETALARVFLTVAFAASGVVEVIHDGDAFMPLYAPASTRVVIPDGYHYVVRRHGGWPSAPTFHVYATDASGNES